MFLNCIEVLLPFRSCEKFCLPIRLISPVVSYDLSYRGPRTRISEWKMFYGNPSVEFGTAKGTARLQSLRDGRARRRYPLRAATYGSYGSSTAQATTFQLASSLVHNSRRAGDCSSP
jgi:hypothetical protein